ncbi:hypothetical protein [Leifsonia poae]|uniref:hypothetical protein n=1 Tax=Leifsonia poae TaxID=110933 RepID=UPI003D66BD75
MTRANGAQFTRHPLFFGELALLVTRIPVASRRPAFARPQLFVPAASATALPLTVPPRVALTGTLTAVLRVSSAIALAATVATGALTVARGPSTITLRTGTAIPAGALTIARSASTAISTSTLTVTRRSSTPRRLAVSGAAAA